MRRVSEGITTSEFVEVLLHRELEQAAVTCFQKKNNALDSDEGEPESLKSLGVGNPGN